MDFKKVIAGILILLLPVIGWGQKVATIGVWEFDETSGTTAIDAAHDNDGTIDGATVNQTGKISKCYNFDGEDDLVDLGITQNFTNFSFSAWIYLDGYGELGAGRIYDKTNGTLYLVNTELRFSEAFSISQGVWTTATSTIALSNWYHIVVTFNNSDTANTPVFYINGVNTAVTQFVNPNGTATTSVNYYIGNRPAKDRSFNGKIDQPAIWNRILTQAEVTYLYNSGNGRAYSEWLRPANAFLWHNF